MIDNRIFFIKVLDNIRIVISNVVNFMITYVNISYGICMKTHYVLFNVPVLRVGYSTAKRISYKPHSLRPALCNMGKDLLQN